MCVHMRRTSGGGGGDVQVGVNTVGEIYRKV